MLSTIRSGPQTLIINTASPDALCDYFKRYNPLHGTFKEVFDSSREDQSVVILTDRDLGQAIPFMEGHRALALPMEMEHLLCGLIADGQHIHIRQLRMAARLILIRGMGDLELCLKAVGEDYPGETGDIQELMNRATDQGAVVAFTAKPLHRTCGFDELYGRAHCIPGPYGATYRQLRAQALKYLNAGIGNRDWVDLEIRIFDRVSAYNLHYQRLLQMIEALELGLVVGESWSKDSPRFMMTVDVYRVRLMTFLDAAEIKRYLVGLEYLEDGMRIADQDVYLNRKKLYWNEVAKGYAQSREALGRLYRNRILERLSVEEKGDFLALEAEIRERQKE